jgi:flotillin
MDNQMLLIGIIVAAIFFGLIIFASLLTTVEAGTIKIVSYMRGALTIFKGPCKAWVFPLFSTSTTIPSKAINIDLDIADQTADIDANGQPRPIKVRVLASAIVSVGDSNEMVRTAANRFFAKSVGEQTSTLTDLLTSTGRRAINLLHHDELFNAKAGASSRASAPAPDPVLASKFPGDVLAQVAADDDDRLAIIIKSACSRELQDLGLVFNSLNIKEVQSEVADARRRQSAVEAKANADIVQADQERRSKQAQLAAEQAVNDKQRELEQRRAENAAIIATAEAQKQEALQLLREAELRATQTAQANADAQRMKIAAEASAESEAIKLRTVATAQAEAIRQVNQAIAEGGQGYLALRQLELIPEIAPAIANALANARMVNISSDGRSAAGGATDQITSVIQTILAAQLVNTSLRQDSGYAPEADGRTKPTNGPVVTPTVTVHEAKVVQTPSPVPPVTGPTVSPRITPPRRPLNDNS